MLFAISVGFVFGLSACTASSIPSTTSDDGEVTINNSAPTIVEPEPSQVLPIDEYLNLVWGTDLALDAQIQRLEAQDARKEELIAECMHAAGFDYTPFPTTVHSVADGVDWRPNDPDWVAQFGFGVINWPGFQGGLQSFGGDIPGVRNPNREFEFSLTGSEREAYERTLRGTPFPLPPLAETFEGLLVTVADEEETEWNNDPNNWGCQQHAWQQVHAESAAGLSESDQFAPLFESIEEFRTNLNAEATDANRDWAVCMAEAGYSEFIVRPAEFDRYFREQLNELTNQLQLEGASFSQWPPAPDEHPAIAEFEQREIDTALADLSCRQATDFDTRQRTAIIATETQFVNDHRAEFDALRAAVEQLG